MSTPHGFIRADNNDDIIVVGTVRDGLVEQNIGVTLLFSAGSARGSMQYPLAIAIVVGTFTGLLAWGDPCPAQTITVQDGTQNQVPQNPQAGQVQPPLPTLGVPGSVITPPTTPGPRGIPVISSPRIPVGIAGRGLPGMAGGPPLKSPLGAQDPSASYMRPPVIGPLFCDPSIDITC